MPNAGDITLELLKLPVLRNAGVCFQGMKQGSRMHQTSRQKLYGFMNWAVHREDLKPIDSPPAMLPETLKPKRIGYPLSDAQILQLLDNLPGEEVHDCWRFAIQILAVDGLRLEELRHLRIKDGASGAELWTI